MVVIAFLMFALFGQEPVFLEVGKPIDGRIDADSAIAHTPTLDANYTNAPTVSNGYQVVVSESGPYAIELRSYDFDAYLVMADENGTLLAEDDDGLIRTHARVVVNLEANHKYTVHACALHGARGLFRLQLLDGTPAHVSLKEQQLAERDDLKAALIYFERTVGKETAEFAEAKSLLGAHYYKLGEYGLAQVEWELVLAIRERVFGQEHPVTAASANNLASLLEIRGDYLEALALHERALAIRQKVLGPEHPDTAASLSNLAGILGSQGNYDKARLLHERALAIKEKVFGLDHPDVAMSLNNLASVLESQGNYEEARPLYERTLAIFEEVLGPEHPYTATILNNISSLLESQGYIQEARPFCERALGIREKVLGPEHPQTATSLNNLAFILESHSDFEGALPLFERALEIRLKVLGPDHPATAGSLSNLAFVLENLGDFELALPLHERALAIWEKVLGPQHPNTALGLNNLAALLEAQGNYEEAGPLHERALEIRIKVLGPEHPDTAQSLSNLAFLLEILGNHEKALLLYERALGIFEMALGPEHPNTATAMNNLAALLKARGNLVEARSIFHNALSGTLDHLDRELPSMSESGRLQLLEISGNPENFISCLAQKPPTKLAEYYATYQRWKGKATRLQAASVKLSQASNTPDLRKRKGQIQVLAKKLSGLILIPLADQAVDHAEQIDYLREERLRLERELNLELDLDLVLATPDFKAVQAGIPPGAVLLDLFVGQSVYAWIVKPSAEPMLISLGDRATLRKAQNAFLSATAVRGGRNLSASGTNLAANYFALLWKPLQEAIGDSSTVFVSPDGFLCELPFGILGGADGGYLLEKHRFVYLADPTSFAFKKDINEADEGPLLAVGGVNYFRRGDHARSNTSGSSIRSRVGESWSSLPATRDEMQSLRDLHDFILEWESPITVVEGKAATEERIRAELPGKRYVHIATHGYFEPDHLPSLLLDAEEQQSKAQLGEQRRAVGLLPGLLSGLVFAGVNGDPDPTRDDGYLSAEEIQHLNLSACDLVVLSACETALGSARAGEGLMSLRRAFAVAGADTVISSLWKVDDVATAQLMKDFYINLWEKSMSRGDALHEAKLRMLRRNRIENGGDALPSTWGAFVLSGDWN
ncbi:MAG: tetratricopeptide repeat protein [Planctomycetes bacterium]|nr:tetratricopeptide repeat protein [Planctomycetota bacterium]